MSATVIDIHPHVVSDDETLVKAFGAKRIAWGSNCPTSPGSLSQVLETARNRLACLSDEDRAWIFAGTARKLYPALNG